MIKWHLTTTEVTDKEVAIEDLIEEDKITIMKVLLEDKETEEIFQNHKEAIIENNNNLIEITTNLKNRFPLLNSTNNWQIIGKNQIIKTPRAKK